MYDHERSLVDSLSGRPFVLLGVNNDSKIATVKEAIKKNNLNWRSWYDGKGGPIVKDFAISGFPTIMLIDHEGVIRYHTGEKTHRGIRSPKVLDQVIENMVTTAEADGMRGGSEPGPQVREFADASGKFKIDASYVDFNNGKVVLAKKDESEIKVNWSKLSPADQNYVAMQRLKGGELAPEGKAEFDFEKPFRFTDSSGDKAVLGTFIGVNSGKAILWKKDGSEVSIPWKRLSDESKDHIKEEIKRLR